MPCWVYTITQTSTNEVVYVGSTKGKYFCLRRCGHTKPSATASGKQQKLYGYIEENGGWSAFQFGFLHQHDEITKDELLRLEKQEIDRLSPICNSNRPIRTHEEYLADARRKGKKHRDTHPDYVAKKHAQPSYAVLQAKRCATHIECECGGRYTLQNKTNHFSRTIHKTYEAGKSN